MFGISLETLIRIVVTLVAFLILLKLSIRKNPDVREVEENFKIAQEIGKNIRREVEIEELSVAYVSNGIVALSGMSSVQKNIEQAGKIAALHPKVVSVSNGILKI